MLPSYLPKAFIQKMERLMGDEANEFFDNNINEYDNYRVIHARSIDELLKEHESIDSEVTPFTNQGIRNE